MLSVILVPESRLWNSSSKVVRIETKTCHVDHLSCFDADADAAAAAAADDDNNNNKTLNSVALVRKRTIPTERPPPVGEVSGNFCG
jgi:hypothetical protein